VIARGRDAADVAISTSFGPAFLNRFVVLTEELSDNGSISSSPGVEMPIADAPALQMA
jgi:hypothetical protein